MKTFVSTTALMLTVVGLIGETSFADHRTGLTDLAHDLEWQMSRVNRTLGYQFRTGPLSREMAADARDMSRLVEDIHELAEHNGCLKTMASKAKDLCELVCELKDHAAEIRPACDSRSSSSRYGCRFGSHLDRLGPTESDIRYLTSLLMTMENTLEDMERELVVLMSVPAKPARLNLPPAPEIIVPRGPVSVGHVNRGSWSVSFRLNK